MFLPFFVLFVLLCMDRYKARVSRNVINSHKNWLGHCFLVVFSIQTSAGHVMSSRVNIEDGQGLYCIVFSSPNLPPCRPRTRRLYSGNMAPYSFYRLEVQTFVFLAEWGPASWQPSCPPAFSDSTASGLEDKLDKCNRNMGASPWSLLWWAVSLLQLGA